MFYLGVAIVVSAFMLCNAMITAAEKLRFEVNFPKEIEMHNSISSTKHGYPESTRITLK